MEWHLTPRGWERGTLKIDPPTDRVLTMCYQENWPTIECREIWSCGHSDQIKPLIERYGPAPKTF